jgi:hypothetical protein
MLILAGIEKHYTHSRYQYSVFVKSFYYTMLNLLIIPGIAFTTASIDNLYRIAILHTIRTIF